MATFLLTSCSSTSANIENPVTSNSPCVESPELSAAVETVYSAKTPGVKLTVYGETGGGSNNFIELLEKSDLAAMKNPNGNGVLVTLVYASGPALARSTAMRTGWLVLSGKLYPINVPAAQAFSLLWDGYPEDIMKSAGIESNYFGLDSYGLEEIVAFNSDTYSEFDAFLAEANQLCTQVTEWG